LAQGVLIVVLLLLYVHIRFQLKVSNYPEVYTLQGVEATKERFDTLCNSRQPVYVQHLFLPDLMRQMSDTAFDNTRKYSVRHSEKPDLIWATVSMGELQGLLDRPTPFIAEGMEAVYTAAWNRWLDPLLSPSLVAYSTKDMWCGSAHTRTPIRYELAFRTYLVGASAQPSTVRLYLPNTFLWNPIYTTNFEFRTAATAATNQRFDTVTPTHVITLNQGDTLYIPAKWWYSVEYTTGQCRVVACKYYTYVNGLCLLPTLAMFGLQWANTLADGSQPIAPPRPLPQSLTPLESSIPIPNAIGLSPALFSPPLTQPQNPSVPQANISEASDTTINPNLEPDTKPSEPALSHQEPIELVVVEQTPGQTEVQTEGTTPVQTEVQTEKPATTEEKDI
jgi:hypothetical protein